MFSPIDKSRVSPDYYNGVKDLLNRLSGVRGLNIEGYQEVNKFLAEVNHLLDELGDDMQKESEGE